MLANRFRIFLFAAVLPSCFAADLRAQPAAKSSFDDRAMADFYRSKTVRIIIGSGAGGTYDIYSRLMSKHMPRFIPGNPALLVQPRPGAGGLIAANAVYNAELGPLGGDKINVILRGRNYGGRSIPTAARTTARRSIIRIATGSSRR